MNRRHKARLRQKKINRAMAAHRINRAQAVALIDDGCKCWASTRSFTVFCPAHPERFTTAAPPSASP